MTPLKIGACLTVREIDTHRDWLFDAERDIELQDFGGYKGLTSEFEDRISAARAALEGHTGRRGIHGPYEGLDMDNKDPELRPLITARFLKALEAADRIGARQMVLHSPYKRWFAMNQLAKPGYDANVLERVHAVMDPVVKAAEEMGITLVIENILDVEPSHRRAMVDSFGSPAIAL
ncbi:MAG TPA: sugar phosphate isomerase/epimerase, partial [Aliiroseovarius sp.]|nr:sugar phosphate isomerase/epimerase [Aliiroseovarius sp.]